MKGGAVAVSASVMAGGIAAVHHPKPLHRHSTSRSTAHLARTGTPLAVLKAHSVSSASTPRKGTHASTVAERSADHRHAPRHRRIGKQPPGMPFTTMTIPPLGSIRPGEHEHHGRRGDSEGNTASEPHSNAPGSDSGDARGGGHHDVRQPGSDGGDRSPHDGRDADPSGKVVDGSSSDSGSSDTSSDSNNRGSGSTDTGRQEDSHGMSDPSEARSSTTTSSPSKEEQGAMRNDGTRD
jgi:hypothetical protein